MITLAAALVLAVAMVPRHQDSVANRLRLAYCHSLLATESADPGISQQRRERAKSLADSLLDRYQAALDASRGRLTEVAMREEAERARRATDGRLSATEFFIVRESCEVLATRTPQ